MGDFQEVIGVNSLELDNYLNSLELKEIKTNKGVTYLNIEAGLDTETSSIGTDHSKVAFMYVWMLGLGHESPVIYGRTWNTLRVLVDNIILKLGLNPSYRLPLYVHNLGFEFQFMRHYFEWEEVFAVDERKPIRALMNGGIEVRDSYILSGYSLENTAKNLTKYKVGKLVGDLDYSLVRHQETPLTQKELEYCKNDIKVTTAYIKEEIERYGNVSKIPMTNTGRVRKYVKNACFHNNTNHKKSSGSKYSKYRSIMNDLTLTTESYNLCKHAFMGGFTHASNKHVGEVLKNVDSVDLSSSYPSVMVAEKFPMSRPKKLTISNMEDYRTLVKTHCIIMTAKFIGVKNKIGFESYISESRCHSTKGAKIDNGRIYSADEFIATITDVDFEIIERVYEWDELRVTNVIGFVKGRLPKPIVSSILNLYEKKTVLKGVEGYDAEYMLSKNMLNSVYGMCVTDVLQNNIEYVEGNWRELLVDKEETIEEYNKSKNRFLYYPWGVWVTAYARRNLWTAIINLGEDYIYSDTDSVKFFNYEKHIDYINQYNKRITARLELACDELGLDKSLLSPVNEKGERKELGIWEHEGHYSHFKTLGAKRYLVKEGGRHSLVVAGLSKQNGMRYIERKCGGSTSKVFDMFSDELYIPEEETGKMTHTYVDSANEVDVIDYLGNSATVYTRSGIHLEPCEFTLSISAQYAKFIKMLRSGYIYRGVKAA